MHILLCNNTYIVEGLSDLVATRIGALQGCLTLCCMWPFAQHYFFVSVGNIKLTLIWRIKDMEIYGV